MKRAWYRLGRALEWSGAVVLVIVCLPLIALAAFVVRGVLLVAAIVGVVGFITLLCVSPRFRHWTGHHIHAGPQRQL